MILTRLVAAGLATWSMTANAAVTTLDFNDFFASSPVVVVSTDGTTATLKEDPIAVTTLLENNPFAGDLQIITAGAGLELLLDLVFDEGDVDVDEFGIFLLDGTAGSGNVLTSAVFDADIVGSVRFDLSVYTAGLPLGLSIQLNALDLVAGSVATVSNLRLVQSVQVSEPGTGLVVALGIVFAYRRRFHRPAV